MSKRKYTKKESKDLTDQTFSTSSSINPFLDQDAVLEMIKALSIPKSISWSVQSYGMRYDYEKSKYQQPERDEQGTLYGYKVLMLNLKEGNFFSPVYPVLWKDGELTADRCPNDNHRHGIYCTKREYDPELRSVVDWVKYHTVARSSEILKSVVVKVACFGTVIEAETGFRAEKAKIVGVYYNGNWKSYQEACERARAYYHSQTQRYWSDEEERYIKGN